MRRLLLTVGTLALLACNRTSTATGLRVALVTPGSVADAAWNSGAYAGLLQLRDSLGAEISNVEARTPAEQEEALRSYAAQGYTIVFGHGFEFQGIAERVGADFPNTIFVITSGERVSGRVTPLIFRIEEATYLAGMVAGGMTRSNIIGFVGGMQLPPIEKGYQGWTNGARALNREVQSRVSYVGNFDDAAAGKEQALAQIRLGADVITHNADAAALGLFQAVKEDPKLLVVGANADQSALAPGQVLGSAVIDLPRAFLLIGREVKEGRFTPHVESFGVASGVVRFDWDTTVAKRVPAALRARVDAARDSIAAGTLAPLGAEQ
ncbi:MAG TPA: BMP family protein [Gemmatimonadales bacterium]|nr:BMP family protein [Gemmatimonadales bacterium]